MTFQRIHKPSASNLPTRRDISPLVPTSFAIQALRKSDSSRTQDEAENEALLEPSRGFGHSFANVPVSLPTDQTPEQRSSSMSWTSKTWEAATPIRDCLQIEKTTNHDGLLSTQY